LPSPHAAKSLKQLPQRLPLPPLFKPLLPWLLQPLMQRLLRPRPTLLPPPLLLLLVLLLPPLLLSTLLPPPLLPPHRPLPLQLKLFLLPRSNQAACSTNEAASGRLCF
jgi:hypothetical protein